MHDKPRRNPSEKFYRLLPIASSSAGSGIAERLLTRKRILRSVQFHHFAHVREPFSNLRRARGKAPDETSPFIGAGDSGLSGFAGRGAASSSTLYDVLVVGAGPSGLAAALHAASQGLSTLIVEAASLGGQPERYPKIDNHLEFATGLSVPEFVRRLRNAQESHAHVLVSREAVKLTCGGRIHYVELDGGETVSSRSVVIASGARYQRLDVPNYSQFEYHGIHYAATGMEAALCMGEDVAVVGGGNSAGQAAVFLAGTAHHVYLLVRGGSIETNMSSYLVQRILHSPHITIHTNTELEALYGDDLLREVTWTSQAKGHRETRPVGNVFVMIGADPQTQWIKSQIALDTKGFVRTGFAHLQIQDSLFAASRSGVFAIGDVRSGSIKRVTASISEGTAVAEDLRHYLSVGKQLAF